MPAGSGIIVDGPIVGHTERPPTPVDRVQAPPTVASAHRPVPWLLLLATGTLLSIALARTPHQTAIAPLIESDYAYQLIAADRLFDGLGLTSLQPVAPNQPWQWEYDWGYLTRWPAGYPILIAAVRALVGGSSIHAAHLISVIACAFALVGWFAVVVRSVPPSVTRYFLAAVAAGLAVPAASLINPSTDAIIMAALPYLILAISAVVVAPNVQTPVTPNGTERVGRSDLIRFGVIGVAAGMLVWIRYASIFVGAGVGLYLLVIWIVSKRITLRHVLGYALGAGVPIAALAIMNHVLSPSASVQSQLNLGTSAAPTFSLDLLTTAWTKGSALGLYNYRPGVVAAFAWWPVVLVIAIVISSTVRRTARRLLSTPTVGLGLCLIVALLAMLVLATALFGEKFNYVGLDRYYLPAKPLYCVLFLAPMLLVPLRAWRVAMGVTLSLAMLFVVQVSWSRTLQRWHEADRPTTPYGAWSRAFEPNARDLFDWLKDQNDPSLIIVSNFHEYVTLETGHPALPIPPDRATLDTWIKRIATARSINRPRVVFALEPDNQWRSYWLPNAKKVIDTFALSPYETDSGTNIHEDLLAYNNSGTVLTSEGTR